MAIKKPLVLSAGKRPIEFDSSTDVLDGAKVVQIVTAVISTEASTNSIIPSDNTIPQSSEGSEFLTVNITPKATTNKLLIEFNAWGGANNTTLWIVALFKDSGANALAASAVVDEGAGKCSHQLIRHVETAGTTSQITFKIRYGVDRASRTIYLLRTSVEDLFATAKKAVFSIVEYSP
jgi:hypothetical protein